MIDKKLEQEFFDNLEENLSKADIAFRAYERGKNDALSVIKNIKAEIEEKEFKLNCTTISDVALKTAYIEVAKLLDKHISELKGENNNG